MSVVILGGNERMERKYIDLCKSYDCDAKVFTKTRGALKGRIGNPDLLVMFTGTLSHKMLQSAMSAAKDSDIDIVHVKSASVSALKKVLSEKSGKN
ncbi:MAG: DUF2325 domain-containing protein [Eubacteriales bacterium]|nr:DUF2325 domain-containing protein [Eubacteriales bacterium]